jgi:divalent metal cation (Fe/Co/Zn/Cd) transporter
VTDRSLHLRRALFLSAISIVWSGVIGAIAVYTALATGSLSLLGFGVDAGIDALASVALVWRFRVEAREPERARRVEHAAERVLGLALMALAAYLIVASVRSLIAQAHPEPSGLAFSLLLASVVVLPPLAVAKYRVAARLASRALRADSLLTGVAGLLAAIGLLSLAASELLDWWWADATAAIVVALVVVREGWASLTLAEAPATDELTQ